MTNFPVPASRKSGGPFLLDMTCSFACPALGKLIFLPSFPPFKCPGWDREKPYTLTGDTLLLRAPGAWQADDAQQVRSARQESGASRPRTISRPMTWAARCRGPVPQRAKAPATPAPFSCLAQRVCLGGAGQALAPSRRASTRRCAGLVATGACRGRGCARWQFAGATWVRWRARKGQAWRCKCRCGGREPFALTVHLQRKRPPFRDGLSRCFYWCRK